MEHDIQVLLRYENDVPGMLWASQIATGSDCGVRIRVYGDKGSLEWRHTSPMELLYAPLNQPIRILTANKEYCYKACVQQCRLPAGHPEGFYEAFANIYHAYCLHLLEKKGETVPGGFRYLPLRMVLLGFALPRPASTPRKMAIFGWNWPANPHDYYQKAGRTGWCQSIYSFPLFE